MAPVPHPRSTRVLVVCTHFPPLNRTGARRPYYLARELLAQGCQVSVLTSSEAEDDGWDMDLAGIEVMRCPKVPVQRDMTWWQRPLARLCWRTRGTPMNAPVRVLADLLLPLDHADRWDVAIGEVEECLGRPDMVIASGPAWSTAQIGSRFAKQWQAMFLLDYRDPWTIKDPAIHMAIISGYGRGLTGALRRMVMRRHERRIGGSAYALTSVSGPVLNNAMLATGNRRGAAFPGGYVAHGRRARTGPNSKFTVAYTGRVYTEQDWDLVIRAMHTLKDSVGSVRAEFTLRLIGPVSNDAGLMGRLERAAKETGLLELVPRMSREEALQAQGSADAVLHLAYQGRRGYLPVKFLEYLNAGRPILLVSREQDLMEDILAKTRTGVIIPDTATLVGLLTERLEEWRAGRTWTLEPDREVLASYEYSGRMKPWVSQVLLWNEAYRKEQAQAGRP